MAHADDPPRRDVTRPVDYDDYFNRHSRLLRIAKRLPRRQLEALAREAMQRLIALGVGRKRHSQWELDKTVEYLCEALLNRDEHKAARMVVGLMDKGVSPEEVYLDYLAAAAKRLNVWWEEDKASFWQVTVATCRILAIMRSMGQEFKPIATRADKSAIMSGVPGEQNVMGLRMATDIFQKDGWHVVMLLGMSHYALVRKIASTNARVIGLSLDRATSLDALSKLIVSLHIVRPNAPIFLNGHGVMRMQSKLAWMDLEGISDNLADMKEMMNAWVETHDD
ncbi:MAG: B12-binding domain-containing protein [Pseudomonadota bacterium]